MILRPYFTILGGLNITISRLLRFISRRERPSRNLERLRIANTYIGRRSTEYVAIQMQYSNSKQPLRVDVVNR